MLWTLRTFLSRHSYYLASRNLTWQMFSVSMIKELLLGMITIEHETHATYLEHHKQPVCNLYLNPRNVMRNRTEVCVSYFFEKHSVINENISYCSRLWLFFNIQSYFSTSQWCLIPPFFIPISQLIMHPWFSDFVFSIDECPNPFGFESENRLHVWMCQIVTVVVYCQHLI